jgi:hypothetical protein
MTTRRRPWLRSEVFLGVGIWLAACGAKSGLALLSKPPAEAELDAGRASRPPWTPLRR